MESKWWMGGMKEYWIVRWILYKNSIIIKECNEIRGEMSGNENERADVI